jgi:hypothetical protein
MDITHITLKREFVNWWAHLASNQGPSGYEPVALPTELWARSFYGIGKSSSPSTSPKPEVFFSKQNNFAGELLTKPSHF